MLMAAGEQTMNEAVAKGIAPRATMKDVAALAVGYRNGTPIRLAWCSTSWSMSAPET